MTSRFYNKIIPWIFKWEGTVFENDPDDPGGATKFGIDQRSHLTVDIKNLTENEATEIYWKEWIDCGCDHLSPPLDWVYFNACVNCGKGRASTFLKQCNLNASKFLDSQELFYRRLAEARPSSMKYLKGWLARTEDLHKVALV
jgi:lysozyme family protein